eukprot:scaffold7284_cov115-Isochrysis_galbana.AAC.5
MCLGDSGLRVCCLEYRVLRGVPCRDLEVLTPGIHIAWRHHGHGHEAGIAASTAARPGHGARAQKNTRRHHECEKKEQTEVARRERARLPNN